MPRLRRPNGWAEGVALEHLRAHFDEVVTAPPELTGEQWRRAIVRLRDAGHDIVRASHGVRYIGCGAGCQEPVAALAADDAPPATGEHTAAGDSRPPQLPPPFAGIGPAVADRCITYPRDVAVLSACVGMIEGLPDEEGHKRIACFLAARYL
jgi:hypothetical protein